MKKSSNLVKASTGSILLAALLCGCSFQPALTNKQIATSNLTQAEAKRLMNLPKMEGYTSPQTLKYILDPSFGRVATLGTIAEVLVPNSSCFDTKTKKDCFPVVPVLVDVTSASDPDITGRIMVRVFPTSETNADLTRLQVGHKILAITSKKSTDDNNLEGFSTGWIFEVKPDGSISNLNSNNEITGSLKDVDKALHTKFDLANG